MVLEEQLCIVIKDVTFYNARELYIILESVTLYDTGGQSYIVLKTVTLYGTEGQPCIILESISSYSIKE